jgi:hypothetical protein
VFCSPNPQTQSLRFRLRVRSCELPGAQDAHWVALTPSLKVPAAHSAQSPPAAPAKPSSQTHSWTLSARAAVVRLCTRQARCTPRSYQYGAWPSSHAAGALRLYPGSHTQSSTAEGRAAGSDTLFAGQGKTPPPVQKLLELHTWHVIASARKSV